MIYDFISEKYFFLIFIRPIGISTFDSNRSENSSLAYHNHPLTQTCPHFFKTIRLINISRSVPQPGISDEKRQEAVFRKMEAPAQMWPMAAGEV